VLVRVSPLEQVWLEPLFQQVPASRLEQAFPRALLSAREPLSLPELVVPPAQPGELAQVWKQPREPPSEPPSVPHSELLNARSDELPPPDAQPAWDQQPEPFLSLAQPWALQSWEPPRPRALPPQSA